eukprot:CAMPEP_0194214692 /NCGR_PEP_ID=MMETSP0156-20130528/16033_1 /TAXON_ID=33649 /ORGANISM="Thalassionema nitzschioides, Strain L26-B" /LENGTH=610 /DNA_ID=CAMNT_0038943015 /DNA_START=47 /DNA_END=1879 /DNA_ORIENTATION=+
MAEPNSKANEPKHAKGSIITNYFLLILFVFGCIQFFINVQQDNYGGYHQKSHIEAFQRKHFDKARLQKPKTSKKKKGDLDDTGIHERVEEEEQQQEEEEENPRERERETLVGLNCDPHGGPSNELAEEMIFWEDIPSDNTYISPFQKQGKKQYLTFESDHGGWNNIRMAMETVMTMAIAMGRTLVLPPDQPMYLLTKGQDHQGSTQRKDFTFSHFFEMDLIADEHMGLEIISMDEFLTREGLAGNLKDTKTGKVVFPPNNRTSYDGAAHSVIANELEKYLQQVGMVPPWDPEKCMIAFPSTSDPADVKVLQNLHEKATSTKMPSYSDFIDRPNPVDAPPFDRMRENWADRQGLCIYEKKCQDAHLIHFGEGNDEEGARLLVHFYAFLFFEDWRQDTWMKRFVRDHVRYIDEIQCAAARIVAALRERVRSRGQKDGKYNAFHIRRGDFQYTVTRFDAPHIIRNSADKMTPNGTIYIASDEKDAAFFRPFRELYDVVFLDDFKYLLKGVNTNYYGMIDSLIASRSEVFFGCWFSTFTGYINRIRGYHNNKKKGPGYEMGYMESYYYALDDRKDHLHHFYPVKKSFYAREFPASWRLIDQGVGELKHLAANKK